MTENVTNHPDMFTDKELENVTAVFRSLETGLRGGTISPDDLSRAMKMLGQYKYIEAVVILKLKVTTSFGYFHKVLVTK